MEELGKRPKMAHSHENRRTSPKQPTLAHNSDINGFLHNFSVRDRFLKSERYKCSDQKKKDTNVYSDQRFKS